MARQRERLYPELSIEELCRKLENEHGCSYQEIRQDFFGRLRTGALLKRAATNSSFPFFPDEYDHPLTDYEIRLVCGKVGLNANDVFDVSVKNSKPQK